MAALAADLGVGRTTVDSMEQLTARRQVTFVTSVLAAVVALGGVVFLRPLLSRDGLDVRQRSAQPVPTTSAENVWIPEDAGPIHVLHRDGTHRALLGGHTALSQWLCANAPEGRTSFFFRQRERGSMFATHEVVELDSPPIVLPCRPGARFYAVLAMGSE